jgi:peptide/nickel transport system permease protein
VSQLDASASAVTGFGDLLPRRSQRSLLRRFSRHRLAAVGLGILLIFGFLATFAPIVSVYDPNFTNLDALRESPSLSHPLGTDAAGRDVWARMLSAGRVSLAVGLLAAAISMVIGTVLGIVSGYVGGWVDNLIQRFTEIVMMFPTLFALILLVAVVGSSVINVIVIIGALGWTGKTRLVRGQVLSLKEMEYVTAARAIGAGGTHLMVKHLLPGVIPYVVVATMLTISGAILSEATLSFLGLGVRIPTATWGNMINSAQSLNVLKNEPWLWLPPGIAISTTVLAVNFVGDGLRDALDPHSLLD